MEERSAGRCEMDSHADTCLAGANCRIVEKTGRSVEVQGFSPKLPTVKSVPIVTAMTTYECPRTGEIHNLILNEALYMPELPFTLLSPNQLRDNGVSVDERPRQFDVNSIFGIQIPESELHIPFYLEGVVAGFETRLPTHEELRDSKSHVELTSPVEWEPHHPTLALAEERVDNQHDHHVPNTQRVAAVLQRKEEEMELRCIAVLAQHTQRLPEIEMAEDTGSVPPEREKEEGTDQ